MRSLLGLLLDIVLSVLFDLLYHDEDPLHAAAMRRRYIARRKPWA